VLRLRGHAGYLHDAESLMVPTVGRELAHGHWGDAIRYQFNLTQGGILWDAGLAALGFKVFGDHLLAWKWYAIGYGLLGAWFGMVILKRTGGRLAAALWPLLLMAAPFLLKDGILTPAGHHTSGFMWALGALAVALGGRAERPSWRRGLAAGLLLGVAMFYMRTAISAGPAVAIALLRGGWRPLLACGGGTLSLPAIATANAVAFVAGGSPYREWGLPETLKVLLWAPKAEKLDAALVPKLLEALSWSLRDLNFAQPVPLTGDAQPLPIMTVAGVGWSAAWLAVPALLVLAGIVLALARRRADDPDATRQLWGTAVVGALVVGYVGTYVLSPFRIDPFLLEGFEGQRNAPGSSGPRYVLPAYLALTVGLAHVLGLGLARPRAKFVAGALATALVGSGLAAAGLDAAGRHEPAETWSTLRPFHYHRMFGPNRGPDLAANAACTLGDPISRANHLRAAGWFVMPGLAELDQNPYAIVRIRDDLVRDFPMGPDELPFVLHGLGGGLADDLHNADDRQIRRAVDATLEAAAALESRREGEALLAGFASRFPGQRLAPLEEGMLRRACRTTAYGGIRPLCAGIGASFLDPPGARLPDRPEALFAGLDDGLVYGEFGSELLRGAGRLSATSSPWLGPEIGRRDSPEARGIAVWPTDLADGFEQGWSEGQAARQWVEGDPWVPTLVP